MKGILALVRFTFLALLALLLLWGGGFWWFVNQIPSEPACDTQTTDAIVVLTGGNLRMERGFELLAAGRARMLFISGVEDSVTLASLLRMRELKAFAGRISPDKITLGYKARSTIGNAQETADWAQSANVASIRLVTGSYHMPRSLHELRSLMPGVIFIAEPVFPSHFGHDAWWGSVDNVALVISEYHKYLATLVWHRLEHFLEYPPHATREGNTYDCAQAPRRLRSPLVASRCAPFLQTRGQETSPC